MKTIEYLFRRKCIFHEYLLRYLDPLLDLRRGKLPHGGGPWWSRLTGIAQMLLFLTALAPIDRRWRRQVLVATALPVSVGQGITIIVLLARKIEENEENN